MKVYPIFLVGLADRRCVVIGGGEEAQRKVEGLLECEAAVIVISVAITQQLSAWNAQGRITWIKRDYRPGDLHDAFMVIATGTQRNTSDRIWQEATAEGALINVVDDVPHCNFIAGAVARQGPLTIAISTSGCAPALAVRLRERFEREFGPEYKVLLELLAGLREPLAARYPDFEERRERWYALVDSDVLNLLRQDKPDLARQRIAQIVKDGIPHSM